MRKHALTSQILSALSSLFLQEGGTDDRDMGRAGNSGSEFGVDTLMSTAALALGEESFVTSSPETIVFHKQTPSPLAVVTEEQLQFAAQSGSDDKFMTVGKLSHPEQSEHFAVLVPTPPLQLPAPSTG